MLDRQNMYIQKNRLNSMVAYASIKWVVQQGLLGQHSLFWVLPAHLYAGPSNSIRTGFVQRVWINLIWFSQVSNDCAPSTDTSEVLQFAHHSILPNNSTVLELHIHCFTSSLQNSIELTTLLISNWQTRRLGLMKLKDLVNSNQMVRGRFRIQT